MKDIPNRISDFPGDLVELTGKTRKLKGRGISVHTATAGAVAAVVLATVPACVEWSQITGRRPLAVFPNRPEDCDHSRVDMNGQWVLIGDLNRWGQETYGDPKALCRLEPHEVEYKSGVDPADKVCLADVYCSTSDDPIVAAPTPYAVFVPTVEPTPRPVITQSGAGDTEILQGVEVQPANTTSEEFDVPIGAVLGCTIPLLLVAGSLVYLRNNLRRLDSRGK